MALKPIFNSLERKKNRAQDWNLFDVGAAFSLFLVTLNLLGWVGNRTQTEDRSISKSPFLACR